MTARHDRRVALVAGAVVAVVCIIGAAVQIGFWSLGTVHHDLHRTIPGPVDALRINARGGDVNVLAGTGGDVVIDAESSGGVHVPRVTADVRGDLVTINGGCPTFNFGHCSATITVRVPADTAVQVDSVSGDVTATGLTRGIDVRTASGDVSAIDVGGTLSLQSASGDVQGARLYADTVHAKTASGDVNLDFMNPPQTADAETASGDASILVPPTSDGYRVEVDTDSGDRSVGVRADGASTRLLRARTHSGDAMVDYGP
jgi:DUF4097 and DUF4098 domain-containing protein YvlB